MATEVTDGQPLDASVVSGSLEAIETEDDLHNVDSDALHLNGTAEEITDKHIADIVEELVNSAEVSLSGGSDTEASKQDPSKLKDGEGKGHARTSSSVKKPTTFKAVSVNKTYLASKGAGSNGQTKIGDKSLLPSAGSQVAAGSSSLSGARPRLVAKSGTGLRDFTKPAGLANGGRAGTAPDPSAVWNKNRPTPAPEPKKYDDEELRRYGIHMASRLHPDDARGQANWADIEDDDEDWAPETITWTDGTKITLPQVDDAPAPTPEPSPATTSQVSTASKDAKAIEKPTSPTPTATASPSIKPGVLASGKGLVLKGAPEKPTLVHKPPAPPTPVKSPWAILPPIERVSPMIPDQGQNQSMARQLGRDMQAPNSTTPPPTKEMSADDFSRSSWRNGPSNAKPDLYNPQSGRYEPAPERRGSTRGESYPRQPAAVLQRPSQTESQGPAEPSAAFQTTRSGAGQDPPYGRRRGSSNVSGGSGSFMHRLTKGGHDGPLPPLEVLGARRPSLTGASDDASSPINFSPTGQHGPPRLHSGQAWQPRASPGSVHATPHYGPQNSDQQFGPQGQGQLGPVPSGRTPEEEYDYQKKLMRERRELAMKRRIEEEAKEEAARRERIRLKLEAMGPAPERKSAKKEGARDEVSTPTTIQQRDASVASSSSVTQTQADLAIPASTDRNALDGRSEAQPSNGAPSGPGRLDRLQPGATPNRTAVTDQKSQPHLWNEAAAQADRYASWGPSSQPSQRNVWGSPNNDRSLGNGTFNADLGRLPEPQMHSLPGPGPIGPPAPNRTGPAQPQAQTADHSLSRIPPIAPPTTARVAQPLTQDQRAANMSAWKRADSILESDEAIFEETRRKREEQQRELEARGLSLDDIQPAIKDTWKSVNLNDDGSRTNVRGVSKVVHETKTRAAGQGWPSSQLAVQPDFQTVNGIRSSLAVPTGLSAPVPPPSSTTPHVRGSRFFPTRDPPPSEPPTVDDDRAKSPTPPPPTMDDHPAYDGDAAHPLVALPPQKPVVRLPPAPAASQSGPSRLVLTGREQAAPAMPAKGAQTASTLFSKPHEHVENWQDKINNLIGRKPSPQKAIGVDVSSRHALDHPLHQFSATVSLPGFASFDSLTDDDGSMTTKEMDESCFEEQEMGSLPTVNIPSKAPDAAWSPALGQRNMPRKFYVGVNTAEPITFGKDVVAGGVAFRISFPWIKAPIMVPIPHRGNSSNRGRPTHSNRGAVGRHVSGASHRGGGKGRDVSGPFSNEHPQNSAPTTASSSRGGRANYRGRSENWSRHPSTTAQS